MERERLRNLTCFRCIHRGLAETPPKRCICEITKRWGDVSRGYYCTKFERVETASDTRLYDGYMRRNLQVEDYRTKRQWEDVGREINKDAKGVEMRANGTYRNVYVYYLPEETHEKSTEND